MALYACYYFTTDSAHAPVEEFINSLDYKSQRKFFFKKGLLEEFGPRLPYPHAKHLSRGIYELRFEAGEGAIRILYFFYSGHEVIFTNGFIKKSNKAPRREKELAIERMALFSGRKGKPK